MKTILKTILVLTIICTLTFSCSKDDSDESKFTETPTAIKKFDQSNFGTYKGVFVGSTGTIVINLNEDNTKSAVLTIDGKEYTYTTTETSTNGQVTNGLTFKNGNSSFDFNVGASGEEPNITNITIVGHLNASIEIQKEQSDKIVKCYVGVSSDSDGSNPAAFNFCILGNNLVGIAHNDDNDALMVLGLVSNNTFTGTVGDPAGSDATIKGTIVGEKFEGTAVNNAGDHFIFSGKRAL
ncbi:hypothetical protein [Flavobacterium undicola]|uniref:hypothetical protein n=1 Tax=Flavobacterium undicola TaxID=1932779 RepID=UPI001376FBC8|nr:hypothetical protein [Flavobacterium undicola]MBA0882155.1 hypothetical protein [Flavobacterium undicola]